jgi:tRNA-dihydrouridine synthase
VETGVDGAWVGRGAIGNPWLFAQARALASGEPLPPPPSLHEQRDVLREHFRLAEQIYGSDQCGKQMRKFGIKYARLHPQWREVRAAFISVRRLSEWQSVLDAWYRDDLPGQYPSFEEERSTDSAAAEADDCSAAA